MTKQEYTTDEKIVIFKDDEQFWISIVEHVEKSRNRYELVSQLNSYFLQGLIDAREKQGERLGTFQWSLYKAYEIGKDKINEALKSKDRRTKQLARDVIKTLASGTRYNEEPFKKMVREWKDD